MLLVLLWCEVRGVECLSFFSLHSSLISKDTLWLRGKGNVIERILNHKSITHTPSDLKTPKFETPSNTHISFTMKKFATLLTISTTAYGLAFNGPLPTPVADLVYAALDGYSPRPTNEARSLPDLFRRQKANSAVCGYLEGDACKLFPDCAQYHSWSQPQ
jgi:hypothetical protein